MNQQLGNDAIKEIRESMRGLKGTPAKQMAMRLSKLHPVTWQHIYKITEDLRPANKTRSDKGNRKFELTEGTDIWYAAQLVIVDKLDPAEALLTSKTRGYTNLPSLEYFQKMLRENGIGKKQRSKGKRAYRQWEAEFPGQLYQIDVTALKVRWEDEKTRRILRIEGVDKNHPNLDDTKIRVWQIMAVDDFSRRRFLRYIATTHVTSFDMVQFECVLFAAWGIPRILYSDNGAEFKGYHSRAEIILNKILENEGGYEHQRHAPGNSQASGKVEVAHKWAEKMDRLIGLAVTEGQKVTIEDLNPFADAICEHYNEVHVHRATGETPLFRWHSKSVIVRKLPDEIIESALLSDEFEVTLDASMTVKCKGISYRIPGQQPFVNFIDQKIKIVVPPNIDLLLVKLPNEELFREIEKVIATADKAGDFKTNAETKGQQLTKRLKISRKAEIAAIKDKSKQTGEIAPIPFFNVPVEKPSSGVLHFPQKEIVISAEKIGEVTPIPQTIYASNDISYWEAVSMFTGHFSDVDECKEFLLTIFGEGEVIAETEVEKAITNRFNNKQKPLIFAVK